MFEEPRQKPPSNFIAGRPKAALLFCFRLLFFSHCSIYCCFSVLHVIPALWPPVLQYCCPLCFVCVLYSFFLFIVVFLVNQTRVGRPQTSSSPPVIFIAGRPKAALLFWFFVDFRCGALLFMVFHVIYKYKNR